MWNYEPTVIDRREIIWNVELVGFADYIIMNYSIFIIHYSLRSEIVCFLKKMQQAAKIAFGIKY